MGKITPNFSGELLPEQPGHGPKLRFDGQTITVNLGSSATSSYQVGEEPGQAAGLVTYTSKITEDSKDALTMIGRSVTGWLLVDSAGSVLARLASDDELVYARAKVAAFARAAGLSVTDWGEVQDKVIDKLIAATNPFGVKKSWATRRELLLFAAIAGGCLVTWPAISQLTYDSARTQALVIFALGAGGFVVGALGLALGKLLAKLPNLGVFIGCFGVAACLAVVSLLGSLNEVTVWRLTPGQTATSILGLGVVFAVMPFWARINRGSAASPPER